MRHHHRSVIIALAVLCLAVTFAVPRDPPAQPAEGPMLVAHIDLERVFNEISAKSQAEVQLEEMRQQFEKKKDELRGQVEFLRDDLELMVPGTDTYEKAERKLREATIDYSAYVEFSKARLERERSTARKTIFQQILRSAESFAKVRGISYLLSDDSIRAVEEGTELQVVQQMAFRRMIFADSSFDVSGDLIEWINLGR